METFKCFVDIEDLWGMKFVYILRNNNGEVTKSNLEGGSAFTPPSKTGVGTDLLNHLLLLSSVGLIPFTLKN